MLVSYRIWCRVCRLALKALLYRRTWRILLFVRITLRIICLLRCREVVDECGEVCYGSV